MHRAGCVSAFRILCRRTLGEIPDHLADALMIEDNRHAARSGKQGDAVAEGQRVRVVHFQAITVHERNRERSERRAM